MVALDYPLCHMEIRLVATSSADAFGQDADRLEFRFYSAADRLDVACSTCAAPPSWLIVSRVSGPTLIKNASWCRNHMARIEGPDQALQLSQLASIHAHWTVEMECHSEEDTGPRISAIAVESNPNNLHLISECPLFRKNQAIVEKEALAVQAHDPATEQATAILPPITGGPAVQPAGNNTASMKALTGDVVGDQALYPHRGVSLSEQDVSVTAPGVPPDRSFAPGSTLTPARRTLDQRRSEMVDFSAMTPSAFVDRVKNMNVAGSSSTGDESQIQEITIEFLGGSLDGSGGRWLHVISASIVRTSYSRREVDVISAGNLRGISHCDSDMTGIDQCLFSLTGACCKAQTRDRSAAKSQAASGVHFEVR